MEISHIKSHSINSDTGILTISLEGTLDDYLLLFAGFHETRNVICLVLNDGVQGPREYFVPSEEWEEVRLDLDSHNKNKVRTIFENENTNGM